MAIKKKMVQAVDDSRPTAGSGSPVGLSMAGFGDAGDTDDSPSARVSELVKKYGGMIEHQPVGVKDGKVQFRWVFHTAAGDAISGNGDNDLDALTNLESRLSAWGA